MAFDQTTRNRLARFVGDCRALLAEEFTRQLQAIYGMNPETGDVAEVESLTLTSTQHETARLLRETMEHYLASADTTTVAKAKKARQEILDRIVREQAFTVLNRLCAIRMAEGRELIIECIGNGYQSKAFQLHKQLARTGLGETGDAYRVFLFSVFDEFAVDLPVLFDRFSPQGRLFPRETALLAVLEEINHADIDPLWAEDETIGWIYQYFNTVEERAEMRKARSPRNSRELAVRNQFFTPRYVVEFLTDNTLGRIWYDMTQGETTLKDSCRYLVRRPNETFLAEGEEAPKPPEGEEPAEDLSQEELLKQPVHIPHRPLKDPRDIKMLDPACGSMHFGLYAFDLFERIYDEAWDLEAPGSTGPDAFVRPEGLKPLHETYDSKEAFLRDVPRLIIERNIHGIDIDPRAVQIAGLSLWLRAQRSWQNENVKAQDRPQIQRSNIVCAEPMPGETDMLQDFTDHLQPTVLAQLMRIVFQKMTLAGEAGSLLRIEDEIRDTVRTAHESYREYLLAEKKAEGFLPGMAPRRDTTIFDFADLPAQDAFWGQAETHLLYNLRAYAEHAEVAAAIRRRLFADDAARGFAFIDLLRQRYDVLLMNPPFGDSSAGSKNYIDSRFPASKSNLLATFIERGTQLAREGGVVGAIVSRTAFFLSSLSDFRSSCLLGTSRIHAFADLGSRVLDAMVETACITMQPDRPDTSSFIPFFRLLTSADKANDLRNQICDLPTQDRPAGVFAVRQQQLSLLEGCPFVYWIDRHVADLLAHKTSLEPAACSIRTGLQTGVDFRFLRLWWEVPSATILTLDDGPTQEVRRKALQAVHKPLCWSYYSKIDQAAVFHAPIHLLVNWGSEGREIKAYHIGNGDSPSRCVRSESFYFLPGFSYMLRSSRLIPYIVPKGVIPTAGRAQIYPEPGLEDWVLGLVSSNVASAVARFRGENFGQPKFQNSMVAQVPYTPQSLAVEERLRSAVSTATQLQRQRLAQDETAIAFTGAGLALGDHSEARLDRRTLLGDEVEQEVAASYGLTCQELRQLEYDMMESIMSPKWMSEGDESEEDSLTSANVEDPGTWAYRVLSVMVGCALGRWQVPLVAGDVASNAEVSPFAPLPRCSPAMLQEGGVHPVSDAFTSPIEGAMLGVVVDDHDHQYDIVRLVRAAFRECIPDRESDRLEEEILRGLDAADLRSYFARTAGFFGEHLKTYTKSRRYAPIYWPLSTPSGSYTLWLYYHRLTDQTLYTCVNDFVDPKLKQVSDEAGRLRGKSNRSSAEEKELERLSDLELELKDFRDELLRIAKFWKPNLNDGVQITAAPLWKFFQHRQWQNRLKETWEKLEAGEYDWAHLALSIWPDRVVPASHIDRSYAIAHDLEDQLWHEVEVEKVSRGGRVTKNKECQPRDLGEAELSQIIAEVKVR